MQKISLGNLAYLMLAILLFGLYYHLNSQLVVLKSNNRHLLSQKEALQQSLYHNLHLNLFFSRYWANIRQHTPGLAQALAQNPSLTLLVINPESCWDCIEHELAHLTSLAAHTPCGILAVKGQIKQLQNDPRLTPLKPNIFVLPKNLTNFPVKTVKKPTYLLIHQNTRPVAYVFPEFHSESFNIMKSLVIVKTTVQP